MQETNFNLVPLANKPSPSNRVKYGNRLIGELHIYVGPMQSGKTTKLNYELTCKADSTPMKVTRLSYEKDVRDVAGVDSSKRITSHSSSFKMLSDKIEVQIISSLEEANVEDYEVIGIDEAQFYNNLQEIVEEWVLRKKKIVYIASLDAWSSGKRCGQAADLIPICSTFKKLTALCDYCMKFNNRVSVGTMTACNIMKEGDIVISGSQSSDGSGKLGTYNSACLECHLLYNKS